MCLLGLSLSAQILLNCLYIADILTLHPQYTGDTPVSICKEQECSPAQPQCIIIPEKLKSDPVVLPNIQSISKLLGLFQGVLNRCFFYFLFFFKPAPDSNQGSSYAFGGKSPWRSFFFFLERSLCPCLIYNALFKNFPCGSPYLEFKGNS